MYVMVDVESDGPCPSLYSMISFGAVIVEPGLRRSFYGQCKPVSDHWVAEALAVSGHTRGETLKFPEPEETMGKFAWWLEREVPSGRRPMFVSDNNGFDWQWINYYFWNFYGPNPFGHSSTNLGSLYKGMRMSAFENFKHLRRTKHSHHPVDDARGNAEALLAMKDMGLKLER